MSNLGKEEATVTLLFTWEVTYFKQNDDYLFHIF